MSIVLLVPIGKICDLEEFSMKRIITAMGNEVLNNELRKYAKYDVLFEDLFCQDILISKISKVEADTIIISGLLQGQWDLEEFVEKIKAKSNLARIIIVTDEIDKNTRKILEYHNIFDVFLDSEIEVKDIIEAIDREEAVRKKYEMISENALKYDISKPEAENETKKVKVKENIILEKMVQKQEIIAISGIPGSGKSTIAANLCKVLSQKSDSKILLIDLDTLNGNIDEMLQISKVPQNIEMTIDDDKRSGINYAVDLIMKNRFDSNVFDELVISANGFDVLTGNTSLHYCQNVLKEEYYDLLLKCAKEKYDFIIIDTSSNIFLDSTKWALREASRILFVTEGNFLSLKKMQQFIEIITKIWGVWKQKIEIIVNKKYKNNIDNEVILNVMDSLKIIGEIKFNEELNVVSYEKILSNINYIPKKSIMDKILDMKNNLFSPNVKVEKEVAFDVN